MENSQITDVCNDGEDNDLESIGKGYPSLTRRKCYNAHVRLKGLATIQMPIKVTWCKLTEMKVTHHSTMVSNVVLSNPHMIDTKN